jgi:hypothetical protein
VLNEETAMICHLCGGPIGRRDGVRFEASRSTADARPAHIECVAMETLRLLYQRALNQRIRAQPGNLT